MDRKTNLPSAWTLALIGFSLIALAPINYAEASGSAYPSGYAYASYGSSGQVQVPVCGNNVCEANEQLTCPSDCGVVHTQTVHGGTITITTGNASEPRPAPQPVPVSTIITPASVISVPGTGHRQELPPTPENSIRNGSVNTTGLVTVTPIHGRAPPVPAPAPVTGADPSREQARRGSISIENTPGTGIIPPRPIPSLGEITVNPNHPNPPTPLHDNETIPNTAKCTDSDGGIFTNTIGIIRINGQIVAADYSTVKNGYPSVVEYYCTDNNPNGYDSITINCPGGTWGGACNPDPITPRSEPPPVGQQQPINYTCQGASLVKVGKTSVTPGTTTQTTARLVKAGSPQNTSPTGFTTLNTSNPENEPTAIEGTIEIWEKPHKPGQQEQGYDYYINTGKTKYRIQMTSTTGPFPKTGQKVKATRTTENNYTITPLTKSIAPLALTSTQTANLGVQKVAIVITKPIGAPDPNTTYLQQEMQIVNNYFKEASYGQTTLQWDTYGPYELQDPPGTYPTPTSQQFNTITLLQQHSIDFTQYDIILSIDQRNTALASVGKGWTSLDNNPAGFVAGFAYVPPDLATTVYDPSYGLQWGIIHELGHTFGALHTDWLDCASGKPIDIPSKCTIYNFDFKTGFDVMGDGSGHISPPQKETIGWLDGREVNVTQNGTYTIYPYEATNEPVVLKIPKTDYMASGDYYYVDYRTATGFDTTDMTGTSSPPGVEITAVDQGQPYSTPNYQIDNPGQGDTMRLPRQPAAYPKNGSAFFYTNQPFAGLDGVVITPTDIEPDHVTISINCLTPLMTGKAAYK